MEHFVRGTFRLYARISVLENGKKGRGLADTKSESVDHQVQWGTEYRDKNFPGMPIKEYRDEGLSAARGDVRPGYEQLLNDLRNEGHPDDVVWAVEQSRLDSRDELTWFHLRDVFKVAGIVLLHTNRDGQVRVWDDVAGIKACISAGERRRMLLRQEETLKAKALNGEPPGGCPFGYRRAQLPNGTKTYEVVEEEAEHIRWAATKVLAGWSISSIVKELDGKGVRGRHGGRLRPQSINGWLTAPTIAGLRVHSGKVIGSGNWQPILDHTTYEAVNAYLNKPRVVTRTDGGQYVVGEAHLTKRASPGRKYLLTGGLAVCGVCGAPLTGTLKQMRNGNHPYLTCHPKAGGKACVGIMLEPTEEYVVRQLFDYLNSARFRETLADDTHDEARDALTKELKVIAAQQLKYADALAAGEMEEEEWQVFRGRLLKRRQEVQAALRALPQPVEHLDVNEVQAAWPNLNLDEQRQLLRDHIAKVTIRRTTPGAPRVVDLSRVVIEWAWDWDD